MKNFFLLPLAAFLSIMVINSAAFGYTESHVSKYVKVKAETVLTGSGQPILYIEPSADHTSDFLFELVLTNAKWKFTSDIGKFDSSNPGVTYKRTDNSSIIVYVNVADGVNDTSSGNDITFDAANNAIEIPLYVEVLSYGEASVKINSLNSTISDATHAFAYVPYGETVSISYQTAYTVTENVTIDNIIIKDDRNVAVSGGAEFKLSLSNGAKFGDSPKITGTGKFLENVKFVKNSSDASKAVVKVINETDAESGSITLEDLELLLEGSTEYGGVELTLEFDGQKQVITVANYQKASSTNTPVVIENIILDGVRPTFSGTAAYGYKLMLYIDEVGYGDFSVNKDSTWSITYKDNIPPLSEGIHEAKVAYYRESTGKTQGEVTKEFLVNDASNDISIKIGESAYYVGTKAYSYSDLIYIKNDRTMLPLRLISNLLGISDSDITWNDSLKEVTLKRTDGEAVSLAIGGNYMMVGERRAVVDSPAEIKNSRVFVPLRVLFNAFDISDEYIKWENNTVKITVIK
ncbi:MAG: stalk domain-containing protein [Lachnospiraceae bacterium]|nr:stalk domain-containing protein [Lachnospiraceae bacterium]